ncbi:MAG: hypothetical protein AMK72_10685 [Planctomycetes bacterium SM23_25]|nr:MAG: hypothetical protein AMK72_10685 [Planctomycetes bacterium SM23_25]
MEEVFPPWYLVYAGVSLQISLWASLLLMVAGALLISRHPVTRRLHLLYAWLMLGLSVLNTFVVRIVLQDAIPPDVRASMSIGAFVGLGWGTVYPIFLLLWFARASVRDEVMSWAEARRQGKRAA